MAETQNIFLLQLLQLFSFSYDSPEDFAVKLAKQCGKAGLFDFIFLGKFRGDYPDAVLYSFGKKDVLKEIPDFFIPRLTDPHYNETVLLEQNVIGIRFQKNNSDTLVGIFSLNPTSPILRDQIQKIFENCAEFCVNHLGKNSDSSLMQNLSSFLERFREVYLRLDEECRIIYASPRASRLFEKPLNQIIFQQISSFARSTEIDLNQLWSVNQRNKEGREIRIQIPLGNKIIHAVMDLYTKYDRYGNPLWLEAIIRDISDLIQKEQEAYENYELYRTLLEKTHDAVYLYRGTQFLYINEQVSTVTGYSPQELYSMNIFDLIHPADRPMVYTYGKNRMQGKPAPEEYICRIVKKNGEVRYCDFHVRSIQYRGEPAAIGTVRDVTEMVEAQKKFESIFNISPSAISLHDLEGKILDCNPAFLNLYKFSDKNEAIGLNAFELIHPNDREKAIRTFKEFLPVGMHEGMELLAIRKDGKVIPILVSGAVIKDDQNQPFNVIIITVDLQELKEKETQIRSLSFASDQSPIPMLMTNSSRKIIYINRAFSRLFGFELEEIYGQNPSSFFSDVTSAHTLAELRQSLEQALSWEGELFHLTKNQESIPIRLSVSPLFDENHQVQYFLAYYHDLREIRRLEKEKEEMQKLVLARQRLETIGTFVSGIAHDFKNILTPIMGYSEMLKIMSHQPEKVQDFAEKIFKASSRAHDLIQQIRSFTSQNESQYRLVHLRTIVEEVLEFISRTIPKSITIETDLDPNVPPVLGDATQLYQVLLNLCTNAVQAMASGLLKISLAHVPLRKEIASKLGIPFEPEKNWITVCVEDTGPGIPAEIRDKIFEPFFTTKEKGMGTGLGLFIVYNIMRNHHGYIHVDSGPGKGTRFYLYFEPAEVPKELIEESSEFIFDHPFHIMIVDDEKEITDMLSEILTTLGFKVIAFNSAQRAVNYIEQQESKPDFLITDLHLPTFSGLQIASIARQYWGNLPILLITGHQNLLTREKMKESGVDSLLLKPVSVSQLLKEIRSLIKKYHS